MYKRKIVLFFLFGGCGGAERMTLNIGKMLPRDEFEVKFVVCGRLDKIFSFIPSEYEVIRIPWYNKLFFPRTRIANVIYHEKPDFVFGSTMELNVWLLLVCKMFKVKCIVRSDNMLGYVSRRMQRKVCKYYKNAYHVIAQQEEMQQELIEGIGTNAEHVVCLHNPLDTETIDRKLSEPNPYPNDGSINYLWVGNYLATKGHDILVEAFKIVHQKNPNTHLYFVGNIVGSLPNYIKTKQIVKDAGLEDCVHFLGQQENPYKWMKYCDCFVLPSRKEGLPNVLLEAMYLNRPVVASVCLPVIDRMVEEGVNGYKVAPEQPKAMAEAMEKAILLKDCRPVFNTASKEDFIQLFKS